MLTPDQVRRRVKAARALADISVKELAEIIDQPGLGERTLRSLEGDSGRPFRPMELRAIADACELPYEFFTADLWSLANALPGDLASQEDLDDVRDDVLQIGLVVADIAERLDVRTDATRDAITSTRAATQALKDRAVGGSSKREAAGGTHDEADATPESARSLREAKQ